MKIICWNLKNIGQTKLTKKLSPVLAAAGLGSNSLGYMMKVVMADTAWQNITTASPADVFVIIELKSGGKAKGAISTGTSVPTLAAITSAMNTIATDRGITAAYQYAYVQPLVTGRHECTGVIYNTKALTYTASATSTQVLRNTATGTYLAGRTPFLVEFTVAATGKRLRLVSVHAPPPQGKPGMRFKIPIQYTQELAQIDILTQSAPADQVDLCLMGDFNCSPASTYTVGATGGKKPKNSAGFSDLMSSPNSYATQLATPTLTSCRRTLANTNPAPANYLSEAYDNILYKMASPPIGLQTKQLDTIGNARDMANGGAALYPAKARMLLSNFWTVSDHIGVVLTY